MLACVAPGVLAPLPKRRGAADRQPPSSGPGPGSSEGIESAISGRPGGVTASAPPHVRDSGLAADEVVVILGVKDRHVDVLAREAFDVRRNDHQLTVITSVRPPPRSAVHIWAPRLPGAFPYALSPVLVMYSTYAAGFEPGATEVDERMSVLTEQQHHIVMKTRETRVQNGSLHGSRGLPESAFGVVPVPGGFLAGHVR
jgi:hypothetical protein